MIKRSVKEEIAKELSEKAGISEKDAQEIVNKLAHCLVSEIVDLLATNEKFLNKIANNEKFLEFVAKKLDFNLTRRLILATGGLSVLTLGMGTAGAKLVLTDKFVELDGQRFYPAPVGAYDATVLKDDTYVWAEDRFGKVIAEGEAGVDDADVINASINYGNDIFISKGIYYINETIKINSNKHLMGYKHSTILKLTDKDIPIIELEDNTKNVFIKEITIEGNSTDKGCGIKGRFCNNVIVKDVIVKNIGCGIQLKTDTDDPYADSTGLHAIINCEAYKVSTEIFSVAPSAFGLLLNNYIKDPVPAYSNLGYYWVDPLHAERGRYIIICSNIVNGLPDGEKVKFIKVLGTNQQEDASSFIVTNNILITDYNISHGNGVCIQLSGSEKGIVSNNIIIAKYVNRIIEAVNVKYLDIENNFILSDYDRGIFVAGNYNKIKDNNILGKESINNYAIWVEGYQNKIINNFIKNCSARGIYTRNAKHTEVYKNTIENASIGIYAYGECDCNIYEQNIIKRYTRGIEIVSNDKNAIIKGNIFNKLDINPELDIHIGSYAEAIIEQNNLKNGSKVIAVSGKGIIKNNIGYPTENKDIAYITGDGTTQTFTVDITHGLVSDKLTARITLDRDGTVDKVYLVDTDGDGFKETIRVQVTFATAPADGESVPIYWYAEVVQ